MREYLDLFGLQESLLPGFVFLLGLPLLYAHLATDVHRDYTEIVKDSEAASPPLSAEEKLALLRRVRDQLGPFELDWWVFGAIGTFLVSLVLCGNVHELCAGVADERLALGPRGHEWGVCSADFNEKSVRGAMSLYATVLGVLIGLKLVWARVDAARVAKIFYASGFRL